MNLKIFNVAKSFRLKFRSILSLFLMAGVCLATNRIGAVESASTTTFPEECFSITGYQVSGSSLLSTNVLNPLFAKYTGTSVTFEQVLQAATDLHYEFCKIGQSAMSVAIARNRLTNGVVTLNVFKTDIPQVVVSGQCYLRFTNSPASGPASPQEMAAAKAAMAQTMAELKIRDAELKAQAADTRVHVVSTNTGPRFAVNKYLVMGNTVLTPQNISQTLTNIDGAFGTNVSFDGISAAVTELQKSYRERGYLTVAVGVPPQKLTNAEVKLQVTEGRLATISVTGNRYFSSNNVMRALPSLHTNMLLNGPIFQAELNRANANRDRQIYPLIGPGPDPGSSALTLKAKDQLPVHGKMEFNNLSSPGTPELRVNTSAEADNLWQLEHSFGVQYSFSPEQLKPAPYNWAFYDRPAVANYSAFYRLPIGDQQPVEEMIAQNPSSFGYNEATHRFTLPPSTGRPELTMYASRSTIDTGVTTLFSQELYNTNGNSLAQDTEHDDTTRNMDIGTRLSYPLQTSSDFQSTLSGGFDFKVYKLNSAETNIFTLTSSEILYNPPRTNIVVSKNYSPVPYTVKKIEYLPLATRYDASLKDPLGTASFGLGLSVNVWYSSHVSKTSTDTNGNPQTTTMSGRDALDFITGSKDSTGHWVALTPSFSHTIPIYTNWLMSVRADGQWASEPLINNEQYGIGGINSVRGYHEGEAFGDSGWHISWEQQTPSYVVGMVNGNTPLSVRGSMFMDYGEVLLVDPPKGLANNTQLWGTGVGLSSAIGSHWQGRFLVSLPLISTSYTQRNEPFFNFILTAQF